LIGGRLIPRIGRPGRVVLLKHDGDRFGVQFLRLREQKIRLGNVAHSLLVKSLLGEPTGLNRLVAAVTAVISLLPAIRHGSLPCR
jgi:hypothetical protein